MFKTIARMILQDEIIKQQVEFRELRMKYARLRRNYVQLAEKLQKINRELDRLDSGTQGSSINQK